MRVAITITGELNVDGPPLSVDLEVDDGKLIEAGVEFTPEQWTILTGTLEVVKDRLREFVIQ